MRRPTPLRVVRASSAFLLACAALASPSLAQIRWCDSLSLARKRAAENKAPIFIALHARGTREGATAIAKLYKDRAVTRLAKTSINVFASDADKKVMNGVKAAIHKSCLFEVRDAAFAEEDKKAWLGPWHIFMASDGKLLFAVPGGMTAAELEWCLSEAIGAPQDAKGNKLSEAAHAPKGLRIGSEKLRAPTTGDAPPTDDEVKEILAEMGRGGRAAWRKARENIPRLAYSDHAKAIELGATALAFTRGERRAGLLDWIGKTSPLAWTKTVQKQIENRDERVRLASLEALGRMHATKASSDVTKRMRDKDESDKVKTRALHTSAVLSPRDRGVVRSIDKLLKPGKRQGDEKARAWAMQTAAQLELRKDVVRILGQGLADASKLVRRSSAYAIAWRREDALRTQLEAAIEKENDAETKTLLEAAKKALERKPLQGFEEFNAELDKVLEVEKKDDDEEEEEPRGRGRRGGGRRGIGG